MILLKVNPALLSLLDQPAVSTTGFTDDVVDETVSYTYSFEMELDDEDSVILVTRDVEYNAARDKLSESRPIVANAPTIVDITTDADNDDEIPLNTLCTLTVEGSTFGADINDLVLVVKPFGIDTVNGKVPFAEGLKYPCEITGGGDLDDDSGGAALTATVFLSSKERYKSVRPGPVEIYLLNTKRGIRSSPFTGLAAV